MSEETIAVVAVSAANGAKGGAERFYEGLIDALERAGAKTELIEVTSDESSFEAIQETYLRCYDLDLSHYYGVISTKAPSYLVRHPNHVCYLLHTMRSFYDMFETEFPAPGEVLDKQRDMIFALDTAALRRPHTKKVYVIGKEVQKRLAHYNGLDSEVLHLTTTLQGFYCGEFRYAFLPGRLHRWKRVDLIIEAMRDVKSPLPLLISGVGEDEAYFRELARTDKRIIFLGRVSDAQLIQLYANALVVPFVPVREDLGLVTLEAFLSRKPVLTCVDSGEPAHFVTDQSNGFVCPPEPGEIAARLDFLYQNVDAAKRMGECGYAAVEHIKWETVASTLLQSLGR